MQRHLIALGLIAGLAACSTAMPSSTHYALVPVKSNGQTLEGMDSLVTLESRQPGGIVSIRAEENFASFGAGFIVAVQNKGPAPVQFGPKNIEASVGGKHVAVLAAEELDAKVKARVASFIRATSRTETQDISNATDAVNRDYVYNNYGGNPAGQGGLAGCIMQPDHCSNYRIDRINRQAQAENVGEAAGVLLASQELIAQRALHTTEIKPNAISGGIMVIEPPAAGGVVDITVTINGQKHQFSFNATPSA